MALLSASFSLLPELVTSHITVQATKGACWSWGSQGHVCCVYHGLRFPTVLLSHHYHLETSVLGKNLPGLLCHTHLPWSQSVAGFRAPSLKEALYESSSRAFHLPPGLRHLGWTLAWSKGERRILSQLKTSLWQPWHSSLEQFICLPLSSVRIFSRRFLHLLFKTTPSRPFHSSPSTPSGVEIPVDAAIKFQSYVRMTDSVS